MIGSSARPWAVAVRCLILFAGMAWPAVGSGQTTLPTYPAQWGPPPGPYTVALSSFPPYEDNMVPAHQVVRAINKGQLTGTQLLPLDARIQEIRLMKISSGTFSPGAVQVSMLPLLWDTQQYVQVPTGAFGIPDYTVPLGIYGVESYGVGGTNTFATNPFTGQPWQRAEVTALQVGVLVRWDNSQGNTPLPAQRLQLNEFTVEVVYRTGPVPTLTVDAGSVQRLGTATFSVTAEPSAVVDNWSFTGTDLETLMRTTNPNSRTWTGLIVSGGTAGVRVVQNGETFSLSRTISVTPRNWHRMPVAPQAVPNGTFVVLPSPPVAGGRIGASQLDIRSTVTAATVVDQGPNHGLKFVDSLTDSSSAGPTQFRYELSTDLMANNSAFYRAQCGNYDPVTKPSGFIRGMVLRSNVQEHEYGTIRGHYQQYGASLAVVSNNPGDVAEGKIGNASLAVGVFANDVAAAVQIANTNVSNAMQVEACNQDVRLDPTCTFRGAINFTPYASCK